MLSILAGGPGNIIVNSNVTPFNVVNVDAVILVIYMFCIGARSAMVKDSFVPIIVGVANILFNAELGDGKSTKFLSLLKPSL